ncbi:hypothetical protein AVEN_42621-1 [Araneus ventricosus]|uniref:Secreted protein n=1 Tax=Araneus ventricosus TaxID=182803 RepID=A0A4Y2SDZ7_ARAVE|nr:hypothetical protein AVEN_42621-1 [Araneus ventricosus]
MSPFRSWLLSSFHVCFITHISGKYGSSNESSCQLQGYYYIEAASDTKLCYAAVCWQTGFGSEAEGTKGAPLAGGLRPHNLSQANTLFFTSSSL